MSAIVLLIIIVVIAGFMGYLLYRLRQTSNLESVADKLNAKPHGEIWRGNRNGRTFYLLERSGMFGNANKVKISVEVSSGLQWKLASHNAPITWFTNCCGGEIIEVHGPGGGSSFMVQKGDSSRIRSLLSRMEVREYANMLSGTNGVELSSDGEVLTVGIPSGELWNSDAFKTPESILDGLVKVAEGMESSGRLRNT
ncbi:MAG: hypothetical protein ABEJ65_11700 [bacterium]